MVICAVLGIDPGERGAMALITKDRAVYHLKFANTTRGLIAQTLFDWSYGQHTFAYLEGVNNRPGEGGNSIWTFAENVGFLKGCLTCYRIDYDEVYPVPWQLALGLGGKKGPKGCSPAQEKTARKNAHKRLAQDLFPKIKMTLDLCDALLIAEYGWRKTFALQTERRNEPHIDSKSDTTGIIRVTDWR